MKEHHKPIIKETGNKIQMARLKKGYSLEELAQKSKVSAATISKIEKGERSFRMSTFFKIGEALDVNFSTLVPDDQLILKQILDFDPLVKALK